MKKNYMAVFLIFAIFMGLKSYASDKGTTIPSLHSDIGKTYDFSLERQKLWKECEILDITTNDNNYTRDKKPQCDDIGYDSSCDNFWSIICGNHWIDEGYNIVNVDLNKNPFISVSSSLNPQKGNAYGKMSVADLNYKTAWVEGINGYGIGEYIEFQFPPNHPRITKVIIANGYIKDKKAWKNNSRVKELKVYLNKKSFVILNLKDVYADQIFTIPTIGYADRMEMNFDYSAGNTYKVLDKNGVELHSNRIRFEIISVYKGDKYQDTAISDIYFDGIDVY